MPVLQLLHVSLYVGGLKGKVGIAKRVITIVISWENDPFDLYY